MNEVIKHSIRFLVLVIVQTMVLNHLEIGLGIQFMVYPLFIVLLPFEMGIIYMLLTAFVMGLAIDSISNTYGLHTSSLLLITYLRPVIFNMFSPREGYDKLKEGNIYEMGSRWFLYVFGLLLTIHHLWFFTLEIFRIDDLLFVLQKTLFSVPLSFLLCLLIQATFVSKPKER
ncbi:MAG: hypothetical protein ACK457_06325 [Flavobacteriia bacterium]|jgi:hypothetical protein